jgi:hypothetical protein
MALPEDEVAELLTLFDTRGGAHAWGVRTHQFPDLTLVLPDRYLEQLVAVVGAALRAIFDASGAVPYPGVTDAGLASVAPRSFLEDPGLRTRVRLLGGIATSPSATDTWEMSLEPCP